MIRFFFSWFSIVYQTRTPKQKNKIFLNKRLLALIFVVPIGHFCQVRQRNHLYVKAFGSNLRKVRLAKGLSQEELAGRADSVLSQIGRIERGERAPTIVTVKKLADALEISPKVLFDFET